MNKCLLCKQNIADKTGSHIIPSFLMKRINGNGMRDHEIGFVIKKCNVDTYFGRDIYEDERKSITDNEEKIYSRENFDIKDCILCKKCEDYFGSLENKYAPSLNLKLSENTTTKNTKVSPSEALLFWCSLVWRASVTGHLGFKLHSDLEERLRISLISNNIDGLSVNYALFRCKDYAMNAGKGTAVCMDIKNNNVLLFVDEYMLVMVFDMEEKEHKTNLFGIGLELKKDNLNDGKRVEEISPLPYDLFSTLMYSVISVKAKDMIIDIRDNIKQLHRQLFKEDIPIHILREILDLIENTGKIGDKYTIKHYVLCYKNVLIKHGLMKINKDNTF